MRLIWAARGRTWGFRFLADAGESAPLTTYERAFQGLDSDGSAFRSFEGGAAFRLPDPLERRDEAGRPLAHDVIVRDAQVEVTSLYDALTVIWPRLAPVYAQVWDRAKPPTRAEVLALLD